MKKNCVNKCQIKFKKIERRKEISNYHEKNRKFGDWIKVNLPTWKLLKKIENKYKFNPDNPKNTSNSDFYIYRKIL